MSSPQQVPSTNPTNDKEGGFQSRQEGMGDTVDHKGVEDSLEVVADDEFPFDNFPTGGGLHPGVGGENPEGGEVGPKGHHNRREVVHHGGNSLPAKEHDTQESGFEHEGHGGFKAENTAEEVADGFGKGAPVGSKLKFHGNATGDADAEVEDVEFSPKASMVVIVGVPGS